MANRRGRARAQRARVRRASRAATRSQLCGGRAADRGPAASDLLLRCSRRAELSRPHRLRLLGAEVRRRAGSPQHGPAHIVHRLRARQHRRPRCAHGRCGADALVHGRRRRRGTRRASCGIQCWRVRHRHDRVRRARIVVAHRMSPSWFERQLAAARDRGTAADWRRRADCAASISCAGRSRSCVATARSSHSRTCCARSSRAK